MTSQELRLCADPADKHAFRYVRSRRLVERPLDDPGPDAPDLVVFQAGQDLHFADDAGGLPPQLWASPQSGRGKVVFDASAEGEAHDPVSTDRLHGMLARVGVPLGSAVYLTQDRRFARDYAEYCQRIGLARGMRIVVHDYWIRRVLAEHEGNGSDVFQRRLERFRRRGERRARRFLSLNHTPRSARLMLLTRLMQDGLWESGSISFGGFEQMERRKGRSFEKIRHDFLRLPGFEAQAARLEPFLLDLRRRGRMVLGDVPELRPYQEIVRTTALPEYDQTWFSVITETEMMDRPSRITEKALKPLLNFHPFVLFGNPGSLALIREYGFLTFPDFADESYDEELAPPARFELAFEQVRRLCRMEEADLARLSAALDETLEFNASWGLTGLPRKFAAELDEALLVDVLDVA